MKKIILKYSFVLGLAVLSASSLSAQKIGYINTQELIQDIPEVKEATANLETFKTQLQKKGQQMIETLQAKYKDLERKQGAGEISPKQLEAEALKLKEEEQSLAQFEQTSQQQIFEKSEQLLKPIRDKVQKAIDDVASENGFTYIIDASVGSILYAQPEGDVSSMVKAKLGL